MRQRWQEIRESRGFREFYFFAVALVLAFGILQFSGTVMNTGKPVVTVVSCSMYPELHVGDILLVHGTDFEDIEQGDIIVYSTEEMEIPIVHRVVKKHDTYLETKGDNNPGQLEFEKHVTPGQIRGVVVFTIPRIGALKLLAMDVAGLNGPRDTPVIIDSYPSCRVRVPLSQRPY
ncbi:MAG: signal peptidase I [Candidatus Nanohaloarchaea archaeon]|nr:signal peptidase I [Candidatus Nanohaloarchaea archaeon]